MGQFAGDFTAPDGSLRIIPSGPVELPWGSATDNEYGLCGQHELLWALTGPNEDGDLSGFSTEIDGNLCDLGTNTVTAGSVYAWHTQNNVTRSIVAPGWTVTGSVRITSYVRHSASDPLPERGPPVGTPLESIEGTAAFDLFHASDATARRGRDVRATAVDELRGWGD
jgi:hypothetical protein